MVPCLYGMVLYRNGTYRRRSFITDGAEKNWKNNDTFSRSVLSFLTESNRLSKLHLDGVYLYANYKGWKKVSKVWALEKYASQAEFLAWFSS